MLDLFRNEILELKSSRDEVGIHIHTFVWNHVLSKWVQTEYSKREAEIVLRSLDMFQGKLGFRPLSVRMGWNAMSNEIIRTLNANDLLVDSSAIPGTFCPGKFDKRDNIYDWSRAPHVPYHPNHDDYQSSGNLKILEIPISTLDAEKSKISADLVNRLSGIKGLVRLVPLAKRLGLNPHHSFYISPWWSSSIYSKIIKAYRKKALVNGIAFLVASFHACDILDPKTGNKNIIFEQYLLRIIEQLSSPSRIEVRFITLSEMARNYEKLRYG